MSILIFPFHSQALARNDEVFPEETLGGNQEWHTVENINTENGVAFANLGSWKAHRGHHFRNAHGILNIIGWGGLLPIGVIVARNFRRVPLKCDEWYNLHVRCQTSGYIVGAIGWGVGLWLGSSSKQQTLRTHRNLGTIIFTFATVQMLAICLQPKREDDHRRWWKIYHQVLGYALIAMIIANIFQGIQNEAHSEKWKWVYVGVLVALGFVGISLEIFRWVKPRIHINF
uniref:Cytochrome b561 domain-containing protein n=1 Tax=Manihot esculenta TaxID=3983 RepID=A0A2C9U5E6_MANES